jgi:hypothetical protein
MRPTPTIRVPSRERKSQWRESLPGLVPGCVWVIDVKESKLLATPQTR